MGETRGIWWRGQSGVLHLRRYPCDIGRGGQRHIGNFKPRLLRLVRPGHDVGHRNIVFQFHLGRRHDRLRMVIGFRRERNDRLAREFRIRLRGLSRPSAARVERGEIFRRLVIDHLRMVEGWFRLDPRLECEEACQSNEERQCDDVISARLQESAPRKRARYEHVRPKRSWSGAQFERGKLRRRKEVSQVADEPLPPRRQLNQKPRNRRGLRDFADRPGSSHLPYSRCGEGSWNSREGIHRTIFQGRFWDSPPGFDVPRKSLTGKTVYNLVFRYPGLFFTVKDTPCSIS